jgi:hypothetical protein
LTEASIGEHSRLIHGLSPSACTLNGT